MGVNTKQLTARSTQATWTQHSSGGTVVGMEEFDTNCIHLHFYGHALITKRAVNTYFVLNRNKIVEYKL